jgi:hypothetical protein
MRQRLTLWNQFASKQWVDLFLPDHRIQQIQSAPNALNSREDAAGSSRLDFTRRNLYRVFNNNSFEEGGRFYGGWWQELPSEYRRYITINWVPTWELDFSNMQAAMLYAREGLALTEDAYSLEGIPATYRKLLKKTFFKLINAQEGQRISPPSANELPLGWTWSELQEALRERHAPISRYLGSGEGIRLQRIDSDIAEQVMMSMMRHAPELLVLPIHDSFLVNRFFYRQLKEEMSRAYRERMGQEIGIDADSSFIDLVELRDSSGRSINADDELAQDPIQEVLEPSEGYEGYMERKRLFLSRQSEEFHWRFG